MSSLFSLLLNFTIYFLQCIISEDIHKGNGDVQYFFDNPKTTILPNGSCNVTHFQCQSNPSNVIKEFAASTPFDCCKACLNVSNCVSWTHWYQNASTDYTISQNPLCHLFKTYENNSNALSAGNCVTGIRFNEKQYGKRPNFVFYYPDTVRAEFLSAYGFPLDTSPNFRSFVENEGVIFNNHIAQHSQCSPSRIAMMTGRYMHTIGHRTQQNLIKYWEPNYFRWMKDSGYYVLWLGKNDALSVDAFKLSVNEWANHIGVAMGANPYKYPWAGYYSFYRQSTNIDGNSTQNGDYAAIEYVNDFLSSSPSSPPEPFIIFIPGMGGHPPYGAPAGYYDKFNEKEVANVYELRAFNTSNKPQYHSLMNGIPYYRNLTSFDDSFFYRICAIYLGRMYYVDWLFGKLLKSISDFEQKTDEKVSVFFSSDHGDFAGDYHLVEKWSGGLDDILIRIPLIARIGNSNVKNVNISMMTQSFDAMETMLDLAQIKREWTSFGVSLKEQLMFGVDGDLNKFVFSEGGFYFHNELYPNGSDHINGGPTQMYWPRAMEEISENGNGSPRCVMIRNVFYKFVFRPLGVSEFYDLRKDPRQIENLYGTEKQASYQDIINGMMMNLTEWFVLTGDVTPILMDSRSMPSYSMSMSNEFV